MSKRPSPESTTSAITTRNWGERHLSESSSTSTYTPYYRTYASEVTPGFRASKRRSPLPENNYQMYRKTYWIGSDYYESFSRWLTIGSIDPVTGAITYVMYEQSNGGQSGWNYLIGDGSPSSFRGPSLVQDTTNRAVLKLQDRASSVKVNLAQFFGERHQFIKMVGSTVNRVIQAARALRRADLRSFANSLSLDASKGATTAGLFERVYKTRADKRLANHWLEFQYGWKPLLSDIHGAAELLARNAVTPRKPHGILRSSAVGSGSEGYNDPLTGLGHLFKNRVSNHHVNVKLKASYMLDDEGKSALAETGMTNPLLLGWELLPYSFVVDWFIPVGNYIASLSAYDGFLLFDKMTSVFTESVVTNTFGVHNTPGNPDNWTVRAGGPFTCKEISLNRSRTLVSYSPRLRSPVGGAPVERVLTALSLLGQVFLPNRRSS